MGFNYCQLTPELTGRGHNVNKANRLAIKSTLFALRLNELLGGSVTTPFGGLSRSTIHILLARIASICLK